MTIEQYRNRILLGDNLTVMRRLPAASVPLIVCSPPYNLRNSTGNSVGRNAGGKWRQKLHEEGYEGFSDDLPREVYIGQQRLFLAECMRVLTDDGAIFYNHKWRVQGARLDRVADEIVDGFPLRQIITWQRAGGVNFNAGYFLPTTEQIYLIANHGFRLAPKANRFGDVWTIRQESRNQHPAPYPVALARRCIEVTTANLVLDPYMGSGTTAVAAIECGRSFIGIERAPSYHQMALRRMRQAHLRARASLTTP